MFETLQFRADAWTTVQAGVDAGTTMSVEGQLDEPHERSPTVGRGLRAAPRGADRANRYASEEGAGQGLDPMRSAYGAVVKANEPLCTRCW